MENRYNREDTIANNILNVRQQIERKKEMNPYIATTEQSNQVLTDYDVFPYTRHFRGVPNYPYPIIAEREAGCMIKSNKSVPEDDFKNKKKFLNPTGPSQTQGSTDSAGPDSANPENVQGPTGPADPGKVQGSTGAGKVQGGGKGQGAGKAQGPTGPGNVQVTTGPTNPTGPKSRPNPCTVIGFR